MTNPKIPSSKRVSAEEQTQPRSLASAFADVSSPGRRIRKIATDIDGTVTRGGVLSADVLAVFERLRDAQVEVIPVSGRPAGEVLGLCRYLPGVSRGVAENGLVEIVPDRAPKWIDHEPDVSRLMDVGRSLVGTDGRHLEPTGDAFCRMGDVTYERDGRDEAELCFLREEAEKCKVHLVWSNVHIHLNERAPDKGAGLLRVFELAGDDPKAVATIGDAPNDEGLFGDDRFGISVGTADILEQLPYLRRQPMFVAQGREAAAFCELAECILANRVS